MGKWKIRHWHKISILLVLYDMLAVNLAYFLGLWLRYDFRFSQIEGIYIRIWLMYAPAHALVSVFIFWRAKLYKSLWRFASFNELGRCVVGSACASVVHAVGTAALCTRVGGGMDRLPVSYYVLGAAIQFMLVLGVRFSYRFLLLQRSRQRGNENCKRVMLIGAGEAGRMILRDAVKLRKDQLRFCCVIDDNRNKWDREIEGIPIVGGRESILANVEKYKIDTIFVTIPGAKVADRRDILNICKESGCKIKNLPGISEIVAGQVSLGDMKEVAVEDLLGREPIRVDMRQIYHQIRDKVILVTGGGGSIGSELCRQVAAHDPRQLIIFDVYENNAYEIQQELRENYPRLDMQVIIGSVRDSRRLLQVFETYRPQIVYHAAAHKHVPLMEVSPCEAIKNNVIGTYKTAYAAMLYNCKRFVLISTDKAVNPTNVMGASKRLCEMVVQNFDRVIKEGGAESLPPLFTHREDKWELTHAVQVMKGATTEFVAVRFGNVLGSNGSVIPLFKRQIAHGGPVTVTHPDIIRYFMTIPEAVSLVMQAGSYARGGEIFILDMGAPVKIDDLARNLIKLSGHRPDEDIQIVYTGLRPGEKLYEEKLMAEEGIQKTENELIHIGTPIPLDAEKFVAQLRRLMDAAYSNDENIVGLIKEMVPTFCAENVGQKDKTYEKLCTEV